MAKITNLNYRKFLDTGMIDIIDQEKLEKALLKVNGIHGKHIDQARAMLIALYYSGARPSEVLDLKGENIIKVDTYVTVQFMLTRKRGRARTIYLSQHHKLVKELWEYSRHVFPQAYMFFEFRGKYERDVLLKNGTTRKRIDITDRLRYYFKRWFDDVMPDSISPYYLRHNRFSQLSQEGASMDEIMFMKGGKSLSSAVAYVHMSSKSAKELAKKIK